MKRAEFEKEKAEIARKLEESELVRKCQDLVILGKKVHFKEHSCRTEVKWEYTGDNLKIMSEDGTCAMGDGRCIEVLADDVTVLKACDDTYHRMNLQGFPYVKLRKGAPLTDCVTTYKPGEWEKKVDIFLEEVPGFELESFRQNFGSQK